MAANEGNERILNCHQSFKELPSELSGKALQTLNKQFYTYRAGHINAVKLGRGAELQAVNKYHQTKKCAIHEAGHVMAIWFGGSMNTVSCATIRHKWSRYHKPRHHIIPERDYPPETLEDLFEELCFCLSGRIAETMFFPEEQAHFPFFIHWKGSDIHKAINIAYYMVTVEFGPIIDDDDYEPYIDDNFLEEISCYLIRGYEATSYLLKTKADVLLKVALELLKDETLEKDRLEALLGPPRKRQMSLYDRFCAFSMKLRPLAKKSYCLTKRKISKKKTKKRKTSSSSYSKRKKSKALARRSKKKEEETQKKRQRTSNSSSRKRSDSVAPKKRITNDGRIVSVYG